VDSNRTTRLRRALLGLCALAAVWAGIVALGGGFIVSIGAIQLSSRNPLNPTVIAVLSGIGVWALSRPRPLQTLRGDAWWAVPAAEWIWERRRHMWASLAAVVAVAGVALVMWQWFVARPLWLDEEMIALNLRDRSVADLAGRLWMGQSAPFGWLAVQRGVVLVFGTGEHALRLLPAAFGVATILVAFWAGRRWLGPVGSIVLILLCSLGTWVFHYRDEVKHFSADAFWALLLPALAAWAVEARTSTQRTRRLAAWWGVSAVGHWCSNGAAMVTPGCALVLLCVLWRRNGWRAAMTFSLFGVAWLGSFALHYAVDLRHTLNSDYLRAYWQTGLPAASLGPGDTFSWLIARFESLALNPIDTHVWVVFWASAMCGLLLCPHRTLGALLMTAPLSAFVLAAFRFVPLLDRLALWIVPALYFGVALSVDRGVTWACSGHARRNVTRLAAAGVVLLVGGLASVDVVRNGWWSFRLARPASSKQGIDDRSGVRWVIGEREAGDAVLTTKLALPALWWYGGIPLSSPDAPGSRYPDGGAILELGYKPPGPECEGNTLREALQGQHRVIVYLGFPDMPEGFDALLFDSLTRLGVITADREFSPSSRATVIDLRVSPGSRPSDAVPGAGRITRERPLEGCVVVRPALRW